MTTRNGADLRSRAPLRARALAFAVHILTAAGAAAALIALLEASREHWAAMFGWLGTALIIDGIDGPLARRLDVARVLPNWSGDVLDLVVDFTTYVFVPAYAVAMSRIVAPVTALPLAAAIVISGALYFADRRMKTDDNHFRGFPALWNLAAFYLFVLHPSPWLASLMIAALVALTFAPIHVLHPLRVRRARALTLGLMALWSALALVTVAWNFQVPDWIRLAFLAIALYVLGSDAAFRLMHREKT
ncbi:MAG: phosphatidylcholine synthase [Xanthobacteraceae bacterium]|nr:MAG: phosphatidylcholine synthase [Xanthobacteraceae bacterium]